MLKYFRVMGSGYSKILREVERSERRRNAIIKERELEVQKEWERIQSNIAELKHEAKESKDRSLMLVKTIRNLWDTIQSQESWIDVEEMRRAVYPGEIIEMSPEEIKEWTKALAKARTRNARDTKEADNINDNLDWLAKQNYTPLEPLNRYESKHEITYEPIPYNYETANILATISLVLCVITWGAIWKLFMMIKRIKGIFILFHNMVLYMHLVYNGVNRREKTNA